MVYFVDRSTPPFCYPQIKPDRVVQVRSIHQDLVGVPLVGTQNAPQPAGTLMMFAQSDTYCLQLRMIDRRILFGA